MLSSEYIENQLWIAASSSTVERCFTEQKLMHSWLNPALRCQPVGEWQVSYGSQMNFMIALPLFKPTLLSTVVERSPGLVVWEFEGFFKGRDRWECLPTVENGIAGTILVNRFEFSIPNPVVKFGFRTFAATWTQRDMAAQLRRLKQVAERLQTQLT